MLNLNTLFTLLLFLTLTACATKGITKESTKNRIGCAQDNEKQRLRSAELQNLVKADQEFRTASVGSIDWEKVSTDDEARRKRVAEIFGEGCFNSAADYSAAAIIYQHGVVPDHYFQAFLWSKRALELGHAWEGHSVANGIDRYLVRIGQKQLFGTQFSQDLKTKLWCIEPIEKTFPDSMRIRYLKMNLKNSIASFLKFYNSMQTIDDVKTCNHELAPSPAGTVPGFW